MPAYHYKALKKDGHESKGLIQAENIKQARQLLRDQSLYPLSVILTHDKKNPTQRSLKSILFQRHKLSVKELALITRQIATLIEAGLTVEGALAAVAEQADKSHIKGLLFAIRAKILEGHTLAAALKEHPQSFSKIYCANIAAGEKSGHLDKVLSRLADYTEQTWHMRQKLTTALIYPSMIVLVAISILGFLLAFVVPKMLTVYGRLHQALPTLTQILLAISDGVQRLGLYALIALVGAIYGVRYGLQTQEKWRAYVQQGLLRVPLIGYILKTTNSARFSRTFAILAASGVPLLEAMQIAATLINVIPIQKAVVQATNKVREGVSISKALKQTQFFSPMTIHMIASGEASGQLENMLQRIADNEDAAILGLIETGLALFEPLVILIMGALVLFIVLAILLPIFQLNDFSG
jgi:general secretion pathway protein F